MNKSFKETLFIINNVLFYITSAIVLTLVVAPLIHQMDVQKYALDVYSGLSQMEIKEEFFRLVDYLWLWNQEPLHLEYFKMSTTGAIHFAEVKVFVDAIQWVFLGTLIVFVTGCVKRLRKKEILFLKQSAKATIFIVGTFLLCGIVAFDALFVWFHQIVFRNDYWIFSVATDPVIKILPEVFFMHGFFVIVLFVFLITLISFGFYHYFIHVESKR